MYDDSSEVFLEIEDAEGKPCFHIKDLPKQIAYEMFWEFKYKNHDFEDMAPGAVYWELFILSNQAVDYANQLIQSYRKNRSEQILCEIKGIKYLWECAQYHMINRGKDLDTGYRVFNNNNGSSWYETSLAVYAKTGIKPNDGSLTYISVDNIVKENMKNFPDIPRSS